MRFWTKQHESVYNTLIECGRFAARRSYVHIKQQDIADIMLRTYDWLFENHPLKSIRPDDAECLIWLSSSRDAAILAAEGRVIMGLETDPSLVYNVNIAKWGSTMNYSYIPKDETDLAQHRKELALRGISDAKALMPPSILILLKYKATVRMRIHYTPSSDAHEFCLVAAQKFTNLYFFFNVICALLTVLRGENEILLASPPCVC